MVTHAILRFAPHAQYVPSRDRAAGDRLFRSYRRVLLLLLGTIGMAAPRMAAAQSVSQPVDHPILRAFNPLRHDGASRRPDETSADTDLPLRVSQRPRDPSSTAPVADTPAAAPAATGGPLAGDALTTGAEGVAAKAAELTGERVAELAKQMREAPGLSEEVKAELSKRYLAATEWLQATDEARRRTAAYEAEIQQGGQSIEAARKELGRALADPTLQPVEARSVTELEALLQDAEHRLSDARTRLSEREDDLRNRPERRAELAKKIEEARQRIAETEAELQIPPPQGELHEVTSARRVEIEARRLSLRATVELYQAEARRSEKLAELFPLQRDLLKRETNLLEKEVAFLQSLLATARKEESERQAREARRQAEMADPALRGLAEDNADLADTRQKISEEVTQITAEVERVKAQLDKLNHDFEGARARVEKAGHSTTVGLLLRRQRDELPRASDSEQRLRFVEQKMPEINLQRLELEEARAELGDLEAVQEQVLDSLDEQLVQKHSEHLPLAVRELLLARCELLDTLSNELDSYLLELGELEAYHRSLIARASTFQEFIEEHVLWIRSTEPIWRSREPIKQTAIALVQPVQWWRTIADSGLNTIRPSWPAAGVLLTIIVLLAFQARWRRQLRELCANRANSAGVRFFPVIHALVLTAMGTAGWPMFCAYLGWRITSSPSVSDFTLAVGVALRYAAGLLWVSGFVRLLCRVDGVADTFFNWPQSGLRVGRNAVTWLTCLGVPLAAIVVATQAYRQVEWTNSLGRVAFICAMWLLAAFFQTTLGGNQNVFREAIAKAPNGWLSRIRIVAYSAGIVLPLMLSVMAMVGFYYSAQQLAIRLQATAGLAFFSLLIHAVVSRWFVVKRRRLAMKESRERQLALQAAQEAGAEPSDGTVAMPPVQEATDWTAVHERLQLLLRQAVTATLLLGGWLIWSDVLPALRILDNVELWSRSVKVVERYEVSSGKVQPVESVALAPTTLRHGMIAAMILVATVVLGRNLPALLEITLLNRLPLDRGGRHAVSIIVHYTVALTGLIIAFRTLSIDWSSVQWLAAGITVGLGFGLQEIFANFVSGMILLFERPIRVGDIITLGDVTGCVTSIRIRATTVTDWDRKELIVPNKDLVTGRLLNWTLSDTTNRILIELAIPFRSDVGRARTVMQQVVAGHANVLREPAPSVTFESFNEGTLRFVIRAYLASLDVRLQTIHELHVALHQRLQSEGIGIALPQRDINVRDESRQGSAPERPVANLQRSDAA